MRLRLAGRGRGGGHGGEACGQLETTCKSWARLHLQVGSSAVCQLIDGCLGGVVTVTVTKYMYW